MKLSVQEIKDRTDELATKLQEAQLQRQAQLQKLS